MTCLHLEYKIFQLYSLKNAACLWLFYGRPKKGSYNISVLDSSVVIGLVGSYSHIYKCYHVYGWLLDGV
jgi:hypothetical protein